MEADISSQAVGLASNADFSLLSLFAKRIETGVFPVPPTYIFPTQIIGILNFLSLVKTFLIKIRTSNIKDKGNNKIAIILILLSQNFGLENILARRLEERFF